MSYPELIGFYSRGRKVGPPKFPDACPDCGAPRNDDPETPVPNYYRRETTPIVQGDGAAGVRWATFTCGGYYQQKPQIQNHTDYFWGRCGNDKP